VVFPDARSALYYNSGGLRISGMLREGHVPIHLFRIYKMAIGRLSSPRVFNLDFHEIPYYRNGNTLEGLNDLHLLGSPLGQRSGGVKRVSQRLEGPPGYLVIASRNVGPIFTSIRERVTPIPGRAAFAIRSHEGSLVRSRFFPVGRKGSRYSCGRSRRCPRGSRRRRLCGRRRSGSDDFDVVGIDPSLFPVGRAHMVIAVGWRGIDKVDVGTRIESE